MKINELIIIILMIINSLDYLSESLYGSYLDHHDRLKTEIVRRWLATR